ncbi:MAG TPA: homoserine dehydrogenase [Candidatus Dormibacteraeota bacterium]
MANESAQRSIGVGVLGLGTVGTAVARRLIGDWELLTERCGGVTPVLRTVAVRDLAKPRDLDLKNVRLVADAAGVVDDPDVAVVVEVMGGTNPAAGLIGRALSAGKTVVTANKAVIAADGQRLWGLGAQHGAGLWFEAAVGAGLPIVGVLRDSLRGDRIAGIDAIINGTTNVILTRMREEGLAFTAALADAQRRGYAEADPSADVDGWDAAQKLVIMVRVGCELAIQVDDVDVVGIGSLDRIDLGYTGRMGYAVKLLAHAEVHQNAAVQVRVRPTAVPHGHELFGVDGAANAVMLRSDLAQRVSIRGVGAGGDSTASAVVSDVVNAVVRLNAPPPPPRAVPPRVLDAEEYEVAQYLRLRITDTDEARELVLQALADRGVPIDDAIDKPPVDGSTPQLLVLTGLAPRAVHDRALETLDSLPVVREIACAFDRIPAP